MNQLRCKGNTSAKVARASSRHVVAPSFDQEQMTLFIIIFCILDLDDPSFRFMYMTALLNSCDILQDRLNEKRRLHFKSSCCRFEICFPVYRHLWWTLDLHVRIEQTLAHERAHTLDECTHEELSFTPMQRYGEGNRGLLSMCMYLYSSI